MPLAWASFKLLFVTLAPVVGLAKVIGHSAEAALLAIGAPQMVRGIVMPMLVLIPETWPAVRAA